MIQQIERLRREHQSLEGLLRILQRQLTAARDGQAPDYHLMREILHYLTEQPDRFHHPYEDLIYDRLLARGACPLTLAEAFHEEHRLLAGLGLECRHQVEDLLGGGILSRAGFAAAGLRYVEALRAHMRREEEEIFAVAAAGLSPGDWLHIDTLFHWEVDPLFGPEVAAEYRALAECIAVETGRADPDGLEAASCAACSAA